VLDDLVPVSVDGELAHLTEDGLASLSARTGPERSRPRGDVRLLPAFDPYVVGVLQHLELLLPEPGLRAAVSRTAGWITPTIAVDGRIVGVWRYQRGAKGVTIELEPFGTLTKAQRAAANRLVEPMASLLGRSDEEVDG
jgi:Winged helix DNA-binding domain